VCIIVRFFICVISSSTSRNHWANPPCPTVPSGPAVCTLQLVHICTSISDRILHVDSEEQPAGRICSLFCNAVWLCNCWHSVDICIVVWLCNFWHRASFYIVVWLWRLAQSVFLYRGLTPTSGTERLFISWFDSDVWHRAYFYIVVWLWRLAQSVFLYRGLTLTYGTERLFISWFDSDVWHRASFYIVVWL